MDDYRKTRETNSSGRNNGQSPRGPRPSNGDRPVRKSTDGTRRPVDGTRRPADGTRRPADGTRRPASGSNRPSGSNPNRNSGNRRPVKKDSVAALKAKHAKQKRMAMIICACAIAFLILIGLVITMSNSVKKDKNTNSGSTNVTSGASGNSGGNSGGGSSSGTDKNDPGSETPAEPTATPTPTVEPSQATLIAVGDDLIHQGVYKAGHQSDGSYDYSVLYKEIKPYTQAADLAILNQETIFGGDSLGLQSYPNFNSPSAIGDAAVAAGFNVITHATNHALDMKKEGLLNCVKYWKEKHPDITMVGIYETPEEQQVIAVKEVNGIKFAILNYTYSHNWESFSSSAEGHLNMLCAYDKDSRKIDFNTINPQVIEDIKKAEELADFTIVCPHWGTEYVNDPTEQEVKFAKLMTEAGADLIIGTHPHVIQPVEWIEADNGNKALCYYSLGNFVSTQDQWSPLMGGMASLTIKKDGNGVYIDEESIKAIPLVTHYVYPGWTGGAVVDTTYLLKDYTDEQAANHGLKPRFGIAVKRDNFVKLAEKVFGKYLSYE